MESLNQDSQLMDPDLKLGHPVNETEVLLSHFLCQIKCKENKEGISV
jgi:hypothetical protein